MDYNPEIEGEKNIANIIARQEQARERVNEILGTQNNSTAEFLLSDDSVPQDFKEQFSVFFDKENALTNINSKDQLDKLLLEFDDQALKYKLFHAHYENTPKLQYAISQMRFKLQLKLLRSTGGIMRERALIQTAITRDERPSQQVVSGGIMNKVTGWFRK